MKTRVVKTSRKAKTLQDLSREVGLIRSFLIGTAGQDSEGSYRPEFVDEMLRSVVSDTPKRAFINGREFLRRVARRA